MNELFELTQNVVTKNFIYECKWSYYNRQYILDFYAPLFKVGNELNILGLCGESGCAKLEMN